MNIEVLKQKIEPDGEQINRDYKFHFDQSFQFDNLDRTEQNPLVQKQLKHEFTNIKERVYRKIKKQQEQVKILSDVELLQSLWPQMVITNEGEEIQIRKKLKVNNQETNEQSTSTNLQEQTNQLLRIEKQNPIKKQQIEIVKPPIQLLSFEDEEFIPFEKEKPVAKPVQKEIEIEDQLVKQQPTKKKQFIKRPVQVNPDLPIFKVKDEFLQILEQSQVIVLTGNTGCGKSTQIPQMIYRECHEKGEAVNIICTQPRRLAAMSLAQRVSDEMQVPVGEKVGYQVGMDAHFGDKTRILLVTTGIFLQRLVYERELFFEQFTHIIMDEVHERDMDIDFSLIIMKHFLKVFPRVRLILMSATICAEKFANYFSQNAIQNIDNIEVQEELQKRLIAAPKVKHEVWETTDASDWALGEEIIIQKELEAKEYEQIYKLQQRMRYQGKQFLIGEEDKPAPIVAIKEGERYPIQTYFLEQIGEFFEPLNVKFEALYRTSIFYNGDPKFQQESVDIMLQILGYLQDPRVLNNIQRLYSTPKQGSMLIFLPGYQEIMDVRDAILQKFGDKHIKIVLLHSTITAQQKDIQQKSDKFRVFLCTNIAESSITVPDCLFVIDFCLTKQIEYNPKNLTEKLSLQYCSQASALQRKGRVGRLFSGICFRLVPEEFFNTRMPEFSECEMLRCPLEKIVLRIKKLDQLEQDIIENAIKFEELDEIEKIAKIEGNHVKNVLRQDQIKVRNLFSNTQLTLAKALDPPAQDQIGNSMRNLQHLGALTIIGDQYSPQLKITNMGLFMCEMPIDIFLTRYLVISCLMGCSIEAITVASLISQRRNFFQHHFNRSQENFLDTLYSFDQGDEDDLLLQFRIFQEWETLFYKPFINQQQTSQDTQVQYRVTLRKFTRQPITQLEQSYAYYRAVDLKNLREVLLQKYELLSRVEGYFPVTRRISDLNDPDLILRMKTAFSASFSSKALAVKQENTKDGDRRIGQIVQLKLNPQRVLCLENVNIDLNRLQPQQAKQLKDRVGCLFEEFFEMNCYNSLQQLKSSLLVDLKMNDQHKTNQFAPKQILFTKEEARHRASQQKKWVNAIEFHCGVIYIVLNPNANILELVHIIKRLLHQAEILKRQAGKNIISQSTLVIKSTKEHDPRFLSYLQGSSNLYELCELLACLIIYPGQARCYAQPNFKETQHDNDSINYIQVSYSRGTEYEKFLAAYDIKERESSKRNYARHSCRIGWWPLYGPPQWMQTIAIIFACNVRLVPNESKTHYEKVICDKRAFILDHYIMEEDIQELNKARESIKNALISRDRIENHQIWDIFKNLMSVQKMKIHFNIDEKWIGVFEQDKKIFLKEIRKETLPIFNEKRRKRGAALYIHNQSLIGSGIDSFKRNFQGDLGQFMSQIEAQRPDFDQEYPRQFDYEGLRLFSQMKQLYIEWKKEQVKYLARLRLMSQRMNAAILVCKECDQYTQIGTTYGIKYMEEDDQFSVLVKGDTAKMVWFRRELQVLTVNIFCDHFDTTDNKQLITEFYQRKYLEQLLQRLSLVNDSSQYHFVTCVNRDHIIGICPKTIAPSKDQILKILICNKTLNLIYPNLEQDEFNFRLLKHDAISAKQQQKFLELQENLKFQQFSCHICVDQYGSSDGFKGKFQELQKHINSQQHKNTYDDLIKSLEY